MRSKNITVILVVFLFIVLVQIWCNVQLQIICPYQSLNSFSVPVIGSMANTATITGGLIIAFFVKRLLDLTKKEALFQLQSEYNHTIDELFTSVRSQQHDLLNHVQAISGFLQMGQSDLAREYLDEMIGDYTLSHRLLMTGSPGLSALLYIKSGIAAARGIHFGLYLDADCAEVAIPPYELNRIVGNIINNAFDHVETLQDNQKVVELRTAKTEKGYCFKIVNCGQIPEHILIKMQTKGFSTKQGEHEGLGLFVVQQLVHKHKGTLEITNSESNNMVVVTVFLPFKTMVSSN